MTQQADLNWEGIFEEIKTQEDLTWRFFSIGVFDTLDVLEEQYDIVAPITDRLVPSWLENALLVSLADPKAIEDLRKDLDFPDHRIYNKHRQLEEDGQITVDRTGRLIRTSESTDKGRDVSDRKHRATYFHSRRPGVRRREQRHDHRRENDFDPLSYPISSPRTEGTYDRRIGSSPVKSASSAGLHVTS